MEKHIQDILDQSAEPKAFRVEVNDNGQGRFFYITPQGEFSYAIADDNGRLGNIRLDGNDHSHCANEGCELDMPLLHAIRQAIQFHEQWSPRA